MADSFKKMIKKKKEELRNRNSKSSTKKGIDKKYISKEKAIDKIYKRIIENSNIPPKFRSSSFDTFDFEATPKENVKKVKQIKVYAENILTAIKGPQSLYIYSSYNGSGKTHIAISVLKVAARKFAERVFNRSPLKFKMRGSSFKGFNWRPVFFMSEVNYLWKKRKYSTSSKKIKQEVDLIEQAVMDAELLVIDDFFSERDTDFVFGNLTAWLNHRYDYNKPVIFTSNDDFKILALDDKKNPYYGTRYMKNATYLASRISEMTKGYQFAFRSSRKDDYRQNSY